VRVWGCHEGEPLHLRIDGIDDDYDEDGWFAKYGGVTYVATGVPLDADLAVTYEDAFRDIAEDFLRSAD
jgi:hypothetical protein